MDKLQEHFTMLLVAPRRSGKSYLIGEMLKSGLIKKYDNIIIMCPTLEYNDDYYDHVKNPKVTMVSNVKNEVIDDLVKRCMDCKKECVARDRTKKNNLRCPSTLIILDDCIDSGVMNFKGPVDLLAERGRHVNISVIATTQRMSAASRSVRLNCDYMLLFSPFSISEIEQFLEQFVYKDERMFLRSKLREIYAEPYQFLVLDNFESDSRKKLKYSIADRFMKSDLTDIFEGHTQEEITTKKRAVDFDNHKVKSCKKRKSK